ncbi:MAG: cysteine hydrolase [Anaerolineae bacterium]
MSVDPWRNPALLIVDMQNDFVREGAPMEVPDARLTIPHHQRLISFCRQAKIPIIYTRFLAGPRRTLMWEWSPQLEAPTWACQRGHQRYYADIDRTLDCADVIDELYPQPGDFAVDKYGYGAFHSTNLEDTLRSLGVESLILTGTVTQICVEETGREAFHHGYKTTMVSDAVSSYLPDLHAATLKNFAFKFGWVKTTAEVLEALAGRGEAIIP